MTGESNARSGGHEGDLYSRLDFSTGNVMAVNVPIDLSDKEFLLTSANVSPPSHAMTPYSTVCLKGTGLTDIIETVIPESGGYIQGRNFTGQVSVSGGKTNFILDAWFLACGDLTLFYKEL